MGIELGDGFLDCGSLEKFSVQLCLSEGVSDVGKSFSELGDEAAVIDNTL